jgi:hypothetical protein
VRDTLKVKNGISEFLTRKRERERERERERIIIIVSN